MLVLRWVVATFAVAFALGGFTPASAQYTFTRIADTSGGFGGFDTTPALNNNGEVSFIAGLRAGGEGVYSGNGGSLTTIATGTHGNSFLGSTSINDSGEVAFKAFVSNDTPTPLNGIYKGSGGAVTLIASASDYINTTNLMTIGNTGLAAFEGTRAADSHFGIYAGSGGAITTIADVSSSSPYSGLGNNSSQNPVVNSVGTVGFFANLKAGGSGLFEVNGGTTTTVFQTAGSNVSTFTGDAAINASGQAAFTAQTTTGQQELLASNGSGGATTIASTAGNVFSGLGGDPGINASGTIAFLATIPNKALNNGGEGIFTGGDPSKDAVILTGMALDGSTVQSITFGRGINDAGSVVFEVTLANGIAAIYRADLTPVPEPSSLILASIAAGSAVVARRRARRG